MAVIIGIDPHKLLHAAYAIDEHETELAQLEVLLTASDAPVANLKSPGSFLAVDPGLHDVSLGPGRSAYFSVQWTIWNAQAGNEIGAYA